MKQCWFIKLVSAIFYQIFIFSPNDNPSKIEKCILFHLKSSLFLSSQIFVIFPLPLHTFQIQKNRGKEEKVFKIVCGCQAITEKIQMQLC